jgi:outer membrane protein assembly factor BamB
MFHLAPTLGVITLPVLAPIAALLQLLFPGLLRDQWKQYRVAITVLLTQSTVYMIHWATITFWVTDRVWWLSDAALTFAIVVVAAVGLVVSLVFSMRRVSMINRRLIAYHAGRARAAATSDEPKTRRGIYIPPVPAIHPLTANPADRPPAQVEYIALSIFAALGILWALYQLWNAVSPLDQVASVTAACLFGLIHLLYRRGRLDDLQSNTQGLPSEDPPAVGDARKPIFATTEVIFLAALVLSGTALGVYFNQTAANLSVDRVVTDWPTYRGSKHRTGVVDGIKAPQQPELLWSFDPREPKGSVMFHSTPTVVDGLVYIGALHQVSTFAEGSLYCINAKDDFKATDARKPAPGQPGSFIPRGTQVWKFTASGLPGGAAKPIFCAPSVHGGNVYFGEGYHEDTNCRLFALSSGDARPQWMLRTTSHTESPPTIFADRIYFGAGDDGVLCYDIKNLTPGIGSGKDEPPSPKLRWQAKNLHIDSAPCVVDGRVFVGTVIGDVHAALAVLALDADTGEPIWKLDTPLPVPGCASHSSGRVYFGLGNGKLGADAENPAGAVWCIDAAKGTRLWEHKTAGGVFSTPVIANGRCFFTSQDRHVYCLDEVTGEVKWKSNVGQPLVCSPVVTDDDVIVITLGGIIKCLNTKDGGERWAFDHKDVKTDNNDVYASPTLSGGRIYVASNGKVHCIGDKPVPPTKSSATP